MGKLMAMQKECRKLNIQISQASLELSLQMKEAYFDFMALHYQSSLSHFRQSK